MTSLRDWLRRRGARGAVTVELAFVLPLLMLFLIGSLQVGLVVVGNSAASNAAREGARAASIRYECADNHTSARCTANPSTNYTLIKNAVEAKLAGLVKAGSVTVRVECRAGSKAGAVVTCERGHVDPDTDVVVVSVGWRHIGATPYVADRVHNSTAHSVIIGRPHLAVLSPEPDTIAPSVIEAFVYDTNTDGVLDQIKLTFSEDIEQQNVNASRFSIGNSVTGSTGISSVRVSNRVVTIDLSGGSSVNTAPGAMAVSLAAANDGIRDYWGNVASFTGQTLTDRAKPVLVGLSDSGGSVNGYPNALDTLTLTFSEAIATSLSTTAVAYTDPRGGGNDTISLSSISAGPMTTNSNNYMTINDSTTTVSAGISKSGNNVIVTLSSPLACSPSSCPGLGTASDSAPWTFTPATSLADAAGNTATGTRTISNLF